MDYFGDPDDEVEASKIHFAEGVRPLWDGREKAKVVVCGLLFHVYQCTKSKTVRVYFGGRTLNSNPIAYTTLHNEVEHPDRANVHIGIKFFTDHKIWPIKGVTTSRGGVLVHELTHTFGGTLDYEFGGRCKQLAKADRLQALANADSYALFVDDSVG